MKTKYVTAACFASVLLFGSVASAQTFSSGSTGADGALNCSTQAACNSYTTPGTFDFDPALLNLNPAGDNIFNFTTINIGAGVTLHLRSSKLRGRSVVWLATGNVTIAGTLDLAGATAPSLGAAGADWITLRVPSEPGPGGYPGGVGARPGGLAYPGLGPGGAPTQTDPNCGQGGAASFAVAGISTPAAPTYGNIQLVPLIGGSGGSGGCIRAGTPLTDASGGTGGAGGGAIRIVSSTSISLTGQIFAEGGNPGTGRPAQNNVAGGGSPGGSGSGGAINLIAPIVTGTGSLRTAGGGNGAGGGGYMLVNATTNTFTPGFINGGVYTTRPLIAPPLPTFTSNPAVTINSVNGVTVPQPPKGQFLTPDVTINEANTVTINISGSGIPLGTVVKLNIQSELGPDQTITCNALAGTTASSTATCSAAFPTSVSRILAAASW